MQSVKDSDPVYKNWTLNEKTIVLGSQSPMDSIAFTAFVTSLEEKIEEAVKRPYALDLEKLYGEDDPERIHLKVTDIASRIVSALAAK